MICVVDINEEEDNKYVKDYELMKINVKKSFDTLITDPYVFVAATSTLEIKEWDKANGY